MEERKMKCKYCGTQLKETARFCRNCGHEIAHEEEQRKKGEEVGEGEDVDSVSEKFQKTMDLLEKLFLIYREKIISLEEEKKELEKAQKEKEELLKKQSNMVDNLKKGLAGQQILFMNQNKEIQNLKMLLGEGRNNEPDEQETEENRCPNCHAVIDEDTVFCGICGIRIR